METQATPEQVAAVCGVIHTLGLRAHPLHGAQRTAIGITGNTGTVDPGRFEALPGVLRVLAVTTPYKLATREARPDNTIVRVGDVLIGGGRFVVIAGPCAVESAEQMDTAAMLVKRGGAHILRGGAFKPRTSPYSFQGLGVEGLKLLADAGARHGLPVVTEAIDHESLGTVAEYADMVQIGARNMQNTTLLKRAGHCERPILLKRGMSATVDELLLAAEYILNEGNPHVVLCERGVRTFADHARNTLDLSAVPAVQRISHLPIIVDPSHATGIRQQVPALACAVAAVGAAGLMVEVHHEPQTALSDGRQSLDGDEFAALMDRVRAIAAAAGCPLL